MRIGPLYDKPCAPLLSIDNTEITMVSELRYLGVFFLAARTFRVSLEKAKRSFNRATNSLLSRLQGTATEDVLLHMIRSKSLPILLFALESVKLPLSAIRSLDFCVIRFAMKVLRSSNRDMVLSCLDYFDFKLPSELIPMRKEKFERAFSNIDNVLCAVCAQSQQSV